MRVRAGLILLLLGLYTSSALAEPTPAPRRWRGLLNTEAGSNFYPWGSEDHSAYLSLFGLVSYTASDLWRVSLLAPANQSLSGLREFTFFDVAVVAGRQSIALGPYLRFAPSVGVVLPTSERSRRRESLYFGARALARLSLQLSEKPGWSWLSAYYDLSVTKAFHEFETATTGAVNAEYRISQWINTSASLSDRWQLSVDLIRSSNLSYQGNFRHSFSITETLSYQLASGQTLSAGVSNEGDVLRANGIDSNLSIFDPVSSRGFISLTLPL